MKFRQSGGTQGEISSVFPCRLSPSMFSTAIRYIHAAEPVYQLQPPRPQVLRRGVDVTGQHVRLHSITLYLGGVRAVADRIEQ